MCKYIQRKWGVLLSILGIVNLTLLIPLLCMHFPRIIDNNLGIDYLGIIVSIITILVTVLIGWNIYNVLNIENKVADIVDDKVHHLTKDMNKTAEEIKHLTLSASLSQFGASFNNIENYGEAFRLLINSMSLIRRIGDPNDNNRILYNEVFDYTKNTIKEILKNVDYIKLNSEEEYELYWSAINGINDRELVNIFIKKVEYIKSDKTN